MKEKLISESRADKLLKRWDKVLNFESKGIPAIQNDHTRLCTAMLLENQEKWCLGENTSSSVFGSGSSFNNLGQSDQYAAGDARVPKILIPMIRRTFPELIANEIVGVQPMSGPVGMAFAMRYRYEPSDLGAGIDGLHSAANPLGTGRTHLPLTQDANGATAGTPRPEAGHQYLDTTYTGEEDTSITGHAKFKFSRQDKGVARLLKNFELTGRVPQMTIGLEKAAVEAGTRRLAARWSTELEQDLKNMNGIDVDTEITNMMSYEIQAEIDREIIVKMIHSAIKGNHVVSWDASLADARMLAERNRDFYQKLIIEANKMAVRNRRGAANFIVATPRVCAMLEMLPEFQWLSVSGTVDTQPVGLAKVGSVGGRFNVYRDTRTEVHRPEYNTSFDYVAPEDEDNASPEYALLGYKGAEFFDTGIIYCPYIPLMIQRTIGPNDFAPRVGMLTRYAIMENLFGSDLYYTLVIVENVGEKVTVNADRVFGGQ